MTDAGTTDVADAYVAGRVTILPADFTQVKYDAAEIAALAAEVAELVGVSNPILIDVDETTPLAKITCAIDAPSSDATVTVSAQSGALENTKRLTTMGPVQARLAIGRMLLRARDRQRADFADVAPDEDLGLAELAAWDTYCVGRLARVGLEVNPQRWRYNHRNRFGFSDAGDASFERLWAADDLGWAEVVSDIG